MNIENNFRCEIPGRAESEFRHSLKHVPCQKVRILLFNHLHLLPLLEIIAFLLKNVIKVEDGDW